MILNIVFAAVVVLSTLVLVIIGLTLDWWNSRRRMMRAVVVAALVLNVAGTISQAIKATLDSGKSEGTITTLRGDLEKAKGDLVQVLKKQDQEAGATAIVNTAVQQGLITSQQAVNLLLHQRVATTTALTQDQLMLVSLSAAEIAGDMQRELQAAKKQLDDRQASNQQGIFESLKESFIKHGISETEATQNARTAAETVRDHYGENDRELAADAKMILHSHQQQIRFFITTAKEHVTSGFGAFQSSVEAASRTCFPVEGAPDPNLAGPCIAALNHIALITNPK